MKLDLKPEEIAYPMGLEITVDGFMGDLGDAKPSQVFMEVYEGKLRVHVWARDTEDPAVSVEIAPLLAQPPITRRPEVDCGSERLRSVILTLQYCLETFEENCQCGRCDPCTRGRTEIEQSIRAVEDCLPSPADKALQA